MPHCDYGSQRSWRWRRVVPWVLGRAAVLITGSTSQGELARALCPEIATRWVRLPSGVPLERFRPERQGDSSRPERGIVRVLSVANLLPVKNPRLLVEAIRVLPSNVCLELAGDGPERAAVKAAVERIDAGSRVVMLGWAPYEAIPALYRRADIFALASWHEDQCAAVQEALASGLPVVSTAVGISRDAVDDGVNGFCVPPGDVVALAMALERLSTDVDLSRRARVASRAYAECHLDQTRQVQRLRDLYGRVAVSGSLGMGAVSG
jgi:glycosyltransferase involved in cell wall biosynthesis